MFNFGELQKQAKESSERWDNIKKLAITLEEQLKDSSSEQINMTTAKLVLLLVEQIKPMVSLDSAEMEQGLQKVFDAFTGGKK